MAGAIHQHVSQGIQLQDLQIACVGQAEHPERNRSEAVLGCFSRLHYLRAEGEVHAWVAEPEQIGPGQSESYLKHSQCRRLLRVRTRGVGPLIQVRVASTS